MELEGLNWHLICFVMVNIAGPCVEGSFSQSSAVVSVGSVIRQSLIFYLHASLSPSSQSHLHAY